MPNVNARLGGGELISGFPIPRRPAGTISRIGVASADFPGKACEVTNSLLLDASKRLFDASLSVLILKEKFLSEKDWVRYQLPERNS